MACHNLPINDLVPSTRLLALSGTRGTQWVFPLSSMPQNIGTITSVMGTHTYWPSIAELWTATEALVNRWVTQIEYALLYTTCRPEPGRGRPTAF